MSPTDHDREMFRQFMRNPNHPTVEVRALLDQQDAGSAERERAEMQRRIHDDGGD